MRVMRHLWTLALLVVVLSVVLSLARSGRDLKDDHGKGKHKFFKHPINFFKKIKKPIIIKKPIVVKKPDVKLIVVKKKEKEIPECPEKIAKFCCKPRPYCNWHWSDYPSHGHPPQICKVETRDYKLAKYPHLIWKSDHDDFVCKCPEYKQKCDFTQYG